MTEFVVGIKFEIMGSVIGSNAFRFSGYKGFEFSFEKDTTPNHAQACALLIVEDRIASHSSLESANSEIGQIHIL